MVHKKTSDSVFEVWTVMARVHPWEMDQKSAKVSESLEWRRIFWQICGEKDVSKTNGCVFLKRNYTWVFPKIRLPQNGWFIIDKYRKPTTTMAPQWLTKNRTLQQTINHSTLWFGFFSCLFMLHWWLFWIKKAHSISSYPNITPTCQKDWCDGQNRQVPPQPVTESGWTIGFKR